jgi:hypothetical protein
MNFARATPIALRVLLEAQTWAVKRGSQEITAVELALALLTAPGANELSRRCEVLGVSQERLRQSLTQSRPSLGGDRTEEIKLSEAIGSRFAGAHADVPTETALLSAAIDVLARQDGSDLGEFAGKLREAG